MEVIRAETAGFCMGVARALDDLDRVVNEYPDQAKYTLGPIIHNPQVLAGYAAQGVTRADDPDEIPEGSVAVIRAHGIPRQVEERLRARGVGVVDATCPRVKKAQVLIGRQAATERVLLLFGEEEHPEVKGLLSYADRAHVFGSLEEFEALPLDNGPYFLAAQTTQDREVFGQIVERLRARCGVEVPVLETICDATRRRQAECMDVAGTVDAMVVVGGRESGNTRRLVDVAAGRGVPAYHVEIADELNPAWFAGMSRIGLTAGASTPQHIIDAVEAAIRAL